MRELTRRTLLQLPAAGALLPAAQVSESPFGPWTSAGANAAALKKVAPWLKGVFATFKWSDLEPADNRFDWKMFESTLAGYADAGLYMLLMVWVGPHAPEWLFQAGVPMVKTTQTLNPRGQPHFTQFPFYLDPNYKRYYHRMIREVASRVDQLPPAVRRRIVCVQTAEGCTGDEGPYKGRPIDKRYDFTEEEWNAFKFETWKLFDSLYRPKKPEIHLLTNSGNQGQYVEWLRENMPHWWRKAGNAGHGYQLNNERDMMAFFDPLINHPESGTLIRARSEMDEMFKGWFQEAPVWNLYWLNLWGLHFGLDIFVHGREAHTNPAFRESFEFYARYGGEKDAATSPGAWCALHDGLDASDFKRFPEGAFGAGKLRGSEQDKAAGLERTVKIAKAFERYGAAQGDPEKGMALVMQNRSAKRMNDVAWNIESGNYQRYLRQHDPLGTSQGYWRVGPKDQPYGRFARGFDVAGGKNAMYFALADRFFGKRAAGARPVEARVVYFDSGRGSWALRYDAAGGEKTALEIRKTDSGRWKEARVKLAGAYLGHRCPHGTDLVLVNTSKENTLFHMVELARS